MKRDYIHIEKDLIPYKFNISLADDIYTLLIGYNETADMVTVGLYKDDACICAGEPLVYGLPLWADVYKEGFPKVDIIPLDESSQEHSVTWENLNDRVFLIVDNVGGDDVG